MVVIGVAGSNGSGKDTVVDLIKDQWPDQVVAETFSTVLRLTLDLWSIDPTRKNLQDLPVAMDSLFGQGSLSRAVAARVAKHQAPMVMLSGARWSTDVDLIRSFPNNHLLFIDASPEVRFERLRQRDEKVGEKDMDWTEFEQAEARPSEAYLPTIKTLADTVIANNGSLSELEQAVKAWNQTLRL